MRKKLIITAAVVISLLLLFFGVLEYRQYSSYKIPIHRDVATIIKLNTDAFIKSLFKEYGFNFRDKIKSTKEKEKKETGKTGIYFPGNIFIYTLKGKQSSTLFCTLPLTDKKDFSEFISRQLNVSFSGTDDATTYDGKLTIAYSKKYVAIAWSQEKEEVTTVLHDLLDKKNVIAPGDKLISLLKEDRSHIVFVSESMNGNIDIYKNEIKIHAVIPATDGFSIPEQCKKPMSDSNSYASLFLNIIPAATALKKEYSIKEYTLKTDSLLSYFIGYADITVSGVISQTDTITTYEFNDNFEKTEKKTATTVSLPKLEMMLRSKPQLFEYLQKQQFISDEKINREIFPLYKMFARQTGENLVLRTDEGQEKQPELQQSENFLEAFIHFDKLRPLTDSTILKKYTEGLKEINITGKRGGAQNATFEGSVLFKAGALKTLADLVKSF